MKHERLRDSIAALRSSGLCTYLRQPGGLAFRPAGGKPVGGQVGRPKGRQAVGRAGGQAGGRAGRQMIDDR
jgi:hypothetical protein